MFGAQNVQVENPAWMSGGVEVMTGVVLPWSRIVIIALRSVRWCSLVWLLLTRTRLGLFVRARHAEPRDGRVRSACRPARVDMLAFGLGSGIAGLAGCALSQIGNVGPDLGQSYIVDSFMVVVLGGVGQLAGTVYAALGLGIVNKFLEAWSGRGAREDRGARVHHPVHPEASAGPVRAQGPDGGSVTPMDAVRSTTRRARSTRDAAPGKPAASPFGAPRCRVARGGRGTLRTASSAAAFVLLVVFPVGNLLVPAEQRAAHVRLHGHARRQDHVLRDRRARDGPDLGLHRHPVARPRPVLRARRLRDGHVPDALDRPRRRLPERPARLHGVPRLEGVSLVLELHRALLVRGAAGRAGAGHARVRVRLLRVPLADQGRLLLDHHAGADVCVHAAVLPQRHRLRRQQRLHRLQAHPRAIRSPRRRRAIGAVLRHRR